MKNKKWIGLLSGLLVLGLTSCGKIPDQGSSVSGTAVRGTETVSGEAISPDTGMEDAGQGMPASGAGATGAADGSVDAYSGQSELSRLSCQLTREMVAGLMSPVIAHMTPEFAAQTTEDQLLAEWETVARGQTGFVGIETVVETVGDEEDRVAVTIRYENNAGTRVNFTFNNENLITKLFFENVVLPSLKVSGESGEEPDALPSCSYEEQEFTVGRKPYELSGVLTVPQVSGKVPVIILFSGGDAVDMDGTVGLSGNTPMRDIAYGLANRGIATLRYHKRGYQYASSVPSAAGLYDTFFQDAWYAIDQIYNDSHVDRNRIYVLGHGEAADYLPGVIRRKEKRLAGAVMLAGRPVAVQERDYSDESKNISVDARYLMDGNSTMPLLILQGEADFETGMAEYNQWKTVLKGRAHMTCRSYKKLNHYFINTNGKTDASEYDPEGKVSTTVTDQIASWCREQK